MKRKTCIKMALATAFFCLFTTVASPLWSSEKTFRILHVMSYHLPWEWTEDQFNGFREPLEGLNIEYKVFEMDTKRRSTDEWKDQVGQEARALIDTWKPDLVYTNDDNAQEYVARYYVDREIPFVFSAVNADPGVYGFVGSKNITGVLEQEHFVETVNFLRKIVPGIRKMAIIVDDDPTWTGVMEKMASRMSVDLPDIRIVHWDVIRTFNEYQEKIRQYQTEVDAVGLLGIHTFKDDKGENVPWQSVLKWTTENSMLPDFSFWKDRILYGTLCAVYVSGYQQGLAAGKIARGILAEGKSPSDYPMVPTIKGQPILSLARAKKLGLKVDTTTLLTVKVVEQFEWGK